MKYSSLKELPFTSVSHNPKITKQTLIPFGDFPPLTNFAQAIFPPGEGVGEHIHEDMLEVFLVQSGNGTISIDGESYRLDPGSCYAVSPGESHALRNDSETLDLVITYFGIQGAQSSVPPVVPSDD
ncbi:MAG: cupin domain-containing protein [Thiotrichales bacterium]